MNNKTVNVAIITGPTGGHFFPGLAIAEQLQEKVKAEIFFFVPGRSYITRWLEQKGFYYKVIQEVRITIKKPLSFFKFIYLIFRSLIIILKGKFDIVVVTGSYTTLPFLLASFLCNKRMFVHEQNFIPGKITKLSGIIADRIALSFPSPFLLHKKKTVITGFPVPMDFKKRYPKKDILAEFNFTERNKTILIIGGSQGAAFLNNLIIENMDYLSKKNFQFIHLAGGKNKEELIDKYKKYGINAQVFEFYFDMAKLYSITDIAICRAGAGTIAEICEWKIPAIVIPYPYAGGHQRYNALYLTKQGGCNMLEQNYESIHLFPDVFEKTLKEMDAIKKKLERISIVDNADNNARAIMELLKNEVQSN
ncbi:MAG: UDP-N-acetylglucosamine--N-acetylmuramyl-(pentapeptide) pyrophosphoryl-undecaprenol N-acetylglucosamine transferase [Candidatus Omnitrophica bacterium]|nr:UDP-N-acetylglucosamine--N-acetylmuramyl-(pentapeptide) pyrophosphoryl-undecaprenol N-acetylglucosamine transferase [Candidatus Omnitrophota bacterium]